MEQGAERRRGQQPDNDGGRLRQTVLHASLEVGVGADHAHRALGEVHHARTSVDQHQADGGERV